MEDRLTIRGLAALCRLGVQEWEQARPQPVSIDLELAIDAARAAKRDDVNDAVDYAALVAHVKTFAEGRPYRLMETLAETVAQQILARFQVPEVRVRVTKRALAEISDASVEVVRKAAVGRRRTTARSPKAALR